MKDMSASKVETPIKWVDVSVCADKWKLLQELCEKLEPHEHYDGMNECSVCDEPLTDALIRQCELLLAERIKTAAIRARTQEE